MGQNLKGKERGKSICQRKDGLYSARFIDKTGKRHEKYFNTVPEARNWIQESKYADKHKDFKGDMKIYEIRNRKTPTEFHNSLKIHKCL